jgi:hypothetical protein
LCSVFLSAAHCCAQAKNAGGEDSSTLAEGEGHSLVVWGETDCHLRTGRLGEEEGFGYHLVITERVQSSANHARFYFVF